MFVIDDNEQKYTIDEFLKEIINYKDMNHTEILKAIEELASCQGSHGAFYNFLISGGEKSEKALSILENQKFKDKVDLVLFLES